MSPNETSRVVTFETDNGEEIGILAGTCESDKRTIYRGTLDGRYAVVPVDELDGNDLKRELPEDVNVELEDMRFVGRPVVIPESGESTVSLHASGQQAQQMEEKGAYGLLWIPFD